MFALRSIDKSFRERNGELRTLFQSLDFTFGEMDSSVAIVGRSGSGKTSLLRILAGLDVDYKGKYFFRGRELKKSLAAQARFRLDNVGIVTQRYDLLYDRDVLRNVTFGTKRGSGCLERAEHLLEQVHLKGFGQKKVGQLSGGEAQRVAIARALMKDPLVILADEPTGALDEGTEDLVLELFADLQSDGVRFVIATHSDRVMSACARRLELRDCQLRSLAL